MSSRATVLWVLAWYLPSNDAFADIPDVCSCECFADGVFVHTKGGNNSYAVPSCHMCLSNGFCETQLREHCTAPADIVAKCYERDALWNSIVPTGFIAIVMFLLVVGLCSDYLTPLARLTEAGRLVAAEEAKIERLAAHGYPLLCIPV